MGRPIRCLNQDSVTQVRIPSGPHSCAGRKGGGWKRSLTDRGIECLRFPVGSDTQVALQHRFEVLELPQRAIWFAIEGIERHEALMRLFRRVINRQGFSYVTDGLTEFSGTPVDSGPLVQNLQIQNPDAISARRSPIRVTILGQQFSGVCRPCRIKHERSAAAQGRSGEELKFIDINPDIDGMQRECFAIEPEIGRPGPSRAACGALPGWLGP